MSDAASPLPPEAAAGNLLDPTFEPTDEQLMEMAKRAWAAASGIGEGKLGDGVEIGSE